jgi:hypothetical protein
LSFIEYQDRPISSISHHLFADIRKQVMGTKKQRAQRWERHSDNASSLDKELALLSDTPVDNVDMSETRPRTRRGKAFAHQQKKKTAKPGDAVKKGDRPRAGPAKNLFAVC